MLDTRIVLACAIAAVTSAIALSLLVRCAGFLGLVDHPDARKRHVGQVPLVGGLAVFLGLLVGSAWLGTLTPFTRTLLATASVIALTGALDDRYDLSVRIRLLVQTACILAIIASTGVYVHHLGHVFGHTLMLGWFGIPFTVVAVIGLINAFNMMDGIDGLAGSLSLVSIGAILLYSNVTQASTLPAILLLVGAALLPYLIANLGLLGRKVFLGDAGSMLLGYLFAWSLIKLSQSTTGHLSPVDVLWCVALPVLDTLAVMYRRIRQGKSPFKPDRGHIHHIIMDSGLGPRRTLACLVALAAALAFFGSVVRLFGTAFNLVTFALLVVVYVLTATRLRVRQAARQAGIVGAPAANDARLPTATTGIPLPRHGMQLAELPHPTNDA